MNSSVALVRTIGQRASIWTTERVAGFVWTPGTTVGLRHIKNAKVRLELSFPSYFSLKLISRFKGYIPIELIVPYGVKLYEG